MSIVVSSRNECSHWVGAVFASSQLPDGAKIIAVELSRHLNFKTGRLDPSAERLARMTNRTARSVFKYLAMLRDGGWISWQGTKGRTSNRYCLLLDARNSPTPHEASPTMSYGAGLSGANLDAPGIATLHNNRAEPCSPIHTNLVQNLEKNIADGDVLTAIRNEIGKELDHWVWKNVEIVPPNTLVFPTLFRRHEALRRYGEALGRLGLTTQSLLQ